MYTDNDRSNNFFESVKKTEVKQKCFDKKHFLIL